MNLIEVAIFNKNWPYVFDLFNPRKLNIIENKGLISNFDAKLANLTLMFLKHLPEHEFYTAVNQLTINNGSVALTGSGLCRIKLKPTGFCRF